MSATLDLDLPAIVLAILSARDAVRTAPHADRSTTADLLAARGYSAHEAVLAFESSYGGLQLFDSDPSAPSLLVGPYACLSAHPQYTGHERDFVPVIFAWDDLVYSLDHRGRGWTCAAMVEGVSRPSAWNGRQLLTQAILWRAIAAHYATLELRMGLHGRSMADERGLGPIEEATSDTEKWWTDESGARFVVEIARGNGYEEPVTYAAP